MGKWIELVPNWVRNGIYAVALSVIGGLIVEYTKEYPIPGAIWSALCLVGDKFIELMTIDIKLWWILILIIVVLIFYFIRSNFEMVKVGNEKEQPKLPEFLLYKKEIVDSIIWEWHWEQTSEGWFMSDIHPCCPKDGARLNQDDCPICKTSYYRVVDSDKAAAIIENRLKIEFHSNRRFL